MLHVVALDGRCGRNGQRRQLGQADADLYCDALSLDVSNNAASEATDGSRFWFWLSNGDYLGRFQHASSIR